jgi:non-ribosomal peptide synthetase component F
MTCERSRFQVGWSGDTHVLRARFVHELIERQATLRAEAAAITGDGVRWSYGELNRRANRCARVLVQRGIGPDQRVAVMVPRSVDMVVCLLAVLKAGAAYVPVDLEYPADRRSAMIEDSAPALVLTGGVRAQPGPGFRQLDVRSPEFGASIAAASDADLTDADRVVSLQPRVRPGAPRGSW